MFGALIFHKWISAVITRTVIVFTARIKVLIGAKFKNPKEIKNESQGEVNVLIFLHFYTITEIKFTMDCFRSSVVLQSPRKLQICQSREIAIGWFIDNFECFRHFKNASLWRLMQKNCLHSQKKIRCDDFSPHHHRRHRKYLLMRLSSVRLWFFFSLFH